MDDGDHNLLPGEGTCCSLTLRLKRQIPPTPRSDPTSMRYSKSTAYLQWFFYDRDANIKHIKEKTNSIATPLQPSSFFLNSFLFFFLIARHFLNNHAIRNPWVLAILLCNFDPFLPHCIAHLLLELKKRQQRRRRKKKHIVVTGKAPNWRRGWYHLLWSRFDLNKLGADLVTREHVPVKTWFSRAGSK
jgi:hypothetical protein